MKYTCIKSIVFSMVKKHDTLPEGTMEEDYA